MGSPHQVGGNGSSNEKYSEQETQSEVVDDVNMTKKQGLNRRFSPRLKEIPQEKRPYYGTKNDDNIDKMSELNSLGHNSGKKKAKIDQFIQEDQYDVPMKGVEDKATKICSPITPRVEHDHKEIVELEDNAYMKWFNVEGFVDNCMNEVVDPRVEETIQIFNNHCDHFDKEWDKRCKKSRDSKGQPASDRSNNGNSSAKRSIKRADLKAVTEMQKKNQILHSDKILGHIPGIPVGYKFTSRSQMAAVGFHGHWLRGIDYISKFSGKLMERYGYNCSIAVAIVMSGVYEDDADYSNEVVYTGQGGNDGKKHQIKDQTLKRGNLALQNNMEQCVPVRFIRGQKCDGTNTKVYTYCGLYKVVSCWADKGVSGCTVFKYRLKRLLQQPKVDIDQIHFKRVSEISPRLSSVVCQDISYGAEDIHIPATNTIDNPPTAPPGFTYTKSVQVATNITIPPNASGCSCKGNCTNPKSCSCAQLNGSVFPYVLKHGGRLIEPKNVVFECGPECGCGSNCINRASQGGLKHQLEVYRVENKGWAVRSWDSIPSGAPVCEYTGILRRNTDLDIVSGNDYIFDIDCWHTMKGIEGRERREDDGSIPASEFTEKEDDRFDERESEFCIDAGSSGNVARFINHSCEPNLFVQCVLSSHHDMRFARVVLFASDDIPPMQELTYDYGYALDSVIGPDGKIKQAKCFCGTKECRGRLY